MQTPLLCVKAALTFSQPTYFKVAPLRHISPTSTQFTILLGLIAGLPALSIDLSAPTLALLPAALNTTVFVAGLSLSLFVLGFGFGQFAGGRGSDRFGRRPILVTALAIYVLAGVCCTFAASGGQLATGRALQGFGAGACSVQAYAMVQDLFTGEAARRKQAYVSVVLTLMPMLAPAVGALIVLYSGWRNVHAAMTVGGLILITVVGTLVSESHSLQPGRASAGFGIVASLRMLKGTGFRRVTIVNALSYASIFAYIAGAPVVIINQLGYGNVVYSAVFACTAAALSGGAMLNARLSHRIKGNNVVGPALFTQALANIGLVLVTVSVPWAVWLLLPLLVVGCFARGVISPNLVHAAISRHRDQAGLAAALVGLAQLLTAAAASALLARLLAGFGAVSVAATMASLTAAAVLVWLVTGLGSQIAEQH